MNHLLEESQLNQVFDKMKFQTSAGRAAMSSFFEILPKTKAIVNRRTNTILSVKKSTNGQIDALWKKAKAAEELLEPYIDNKTDLIGQAESQLFFTGEHTKILNTVPYLITILLILKIWVAPIMGLMMPFMFFIAPYVIVKLVMKVPIPWNVYISMMKELVLGVKGDQPIGIKQLSQGLYLVTSFGQGMVQPVLTAQQTYKTDLKIKEIGSAINEYIGTTAEIFTTLYQKDTLQKLPPLPLDMSARDAYWWFKDNHLFFKSWRHQVGCMDVYYTLAKDSAWRPVEWSPVAEFQFEGLADLCIKEPIKSDIVYSQHNLMTGPNRGGKSSFLRAVLQQVLFSRVLGITNCERASLPWIHWIHSRIRSLDKPGEASLFEEDVKSCAGILKCVDVAEHGLVLIDELFHSTNPPDALFCARTFLGEFWNCESATSIISTHSFELLNELPEHVKTLCCPASEDSEGEIKYSYKVEPGVCKLSSVREVLKEAGFRL